MKANAPNVAAAWQFHEDGSTPPTGDAWVFVFGSNLSGRHGAGAALVALKRYGAVAGVGQGFQGRAYAIPTKGMKLEILELGPISLAVERFLNDARHMSHRMFFVTRIGCGLAGYEDRQIAPMFRRATANFSFPLPWRRYLT